MSITAGLPRIQEKGNQKSFHQRHNSGELDVFEAAGYFSGSNDINGSSFTPQLKAMRPSGRMSLDIPVMSSKRSSPAPTHHQKVIKDEKKFKQPNSPGGKLASFLNSLFNQTSSKTKNSKISSSQSMKDDQDHEIGRRKRRSSISHFRSVNTTSSNCNSSDSKSSSFYSSSASSEKRPPSAKISTKNSSKGVQNHSEHNPDVMANSLSKIKNNINVHVKSSSSHRKVHTENTENSWLDEEKFGFQIPNEKSSEKYNDKSFLKGASGDKINHSKDSANFINIINDVDDGADSDSSSDLFELQNYDLISCYSSDLPVYETTHIDAIKRGAPIVSSAM